LSKVLVEHIAQYPSWQEFKLIASRTRLIRHRLIRQFA